MSHYYFKRSVILLFLFMIWPATVSGQSENREKVIEGAKKEGRFVWYTSTNVSDSRPMLDDFETKFPFLRGELFRASTEKILNRVMTETRAGKWDFDLLTLSEMDFLMEHKLVAPYRSAESKHFSAEFKDADGHWTAVYTNYFVIGYNTQMVPANEAPKSWEDLLDPKWKGKISIDQEEYPWYSTLMKAWGKERTQKYMQALAKQNIQWRKGHTLIAQLMSAGEFPVAIVYAHRAEDMKRKGAPLEWVDTVDPIVVSMNSAALSAKPRHPNAAKLFIDYLLSKPAQEKIRSFNRIPARSDVDPLSPKMDQSKLKLMAVPLQSAETFNRHVREFREIFGL